MGLREQIHYISTWGDSYLLLSPLKSPIWEQLRQGLFNKYYSLWGFWFALLATFLSFTTELFALSLRIIFRIRHGKNALGVIIVCAAALNICIINNEKSLHAYSEFFVALFKVFYALFTDFSQVNLQHLSASLWQPESSALTLFLGLFLVSGLVQVFGLYFLEWRNDNPFKKGNSLIYLLLGKIINLKESYYQVLFEPALGFTTGYLFFFHLGDRLFGTYLILSSGSLWLQEFIDYLSRQTYGK